MRIREILQQKGNQVFTVKPESTVRDLVAFLNEHNIGALVVSSDGAAVEGIVSERDVVRHLASGAGALDLQVRDIMTSDVHDCSPSDHVDSLMHLMTDERIRHVPVIADGRLAGIISIGDVVKSRIGELEFERDQLSKYVANAQ
ncbi:MAG: CBS domain-containing protein [Propionibacteriales bacterium]|nr:CBS domain-containing protein [Propionibacteriales bacterium]